MLAKNFVIIFIYVLPASAFGEMKCHISNYCRWSKGLVWKILRDSLS